MNKTDRIIELKKLLDSDLITQSDFDRLKLQIFEEQDFSKSENEVLDNGLKKSNVTSVKNPPDNPSVDKSKNPFSQDKSTKYIVISLVVITVLIIILINKRQQNNDNIKIENSESIIDSTINMPAAIPAERLVQEDIVDTTSIEIDSKNNNEINNLKYNLGQELNGGIIFRLNEDQTGGLLFYDAKKNMDFEDAKKWCENMNLRLPTIEELEIILDNYDVSKAKYYFWSSDIASDIEKKKFTILCHIIKRNGNDVSDEENNFIKCYHHYYKKIYLFQNNIDCDEPCNTLGVTSF